MKNKLHRSITLFMAFLVLLSSTGFGFIEHQCMMRGKSMQFVSKSKSVEKTGSSCCAKSRALKESKGTYFKKTDCCKESQKFEKVETVSLQSSALVKSAKVLAGDLLWSMQSFKFILSEWTNPDSNFKFKEAKSFSSLLHGRSLLSFVQSFLI